MVIDEATHPAYGIAGTTPSGPQCSQHKDVFCFFCEFSSSGPADSGSDIDLRGTLVSLVNLLHREKREFPHIIKAVHERYRARIQQFVPDNPDWSMDSIRRHLLYSTEFGALFNNVVTQVFQTVICNLNENMLDDDQKVNGIRLKQFLETVKEYRSWQKADQQPEKH